MSFWACDRKLYFAQFCGCIDYMNGILSACMCVLARNILSQSSCSLCSYVCIGLPIPPHPPKVKYSLSACTSKQLDRIFHFVRVCWSWKANTYIQAERTTALRQNISGQYTHSYQQRERETDGFHAFLLSGRPCLVFPSKIMVGNDDVWLCDWISKTLHK